MEADAVILAAGDFPSHPNASAWLDHEHVVCCDSAAVAFAESGRKPWRCIGDGDSLPEEWKERLHFITESEQETNDLAKAVRLVQREVGREARIVIIGATGKREDHTLGNIALLTDLMEMGVRATMYTDHGVFISCYGTRTFTATDFLPSSETLCGHPLSVFNVSCSMLQSIGLDYPIYPFTRLWQGTLNRINADTFRIDADGAYLLFIGY